MTLPLWVEAGRSRVWLSAMAAAESGLVDTFIFLQEIMISYLYDSAPASEIVTDPQTLPKRDWRERRHLLWRDDERSLRTAPSRLATGRPWRLGPERARPGRGRGGGGGTRR